MSCGKHGPRVGHLAELADDDADPADLGGVGDQLGGAVAGGLGAALGGSGLELAEPAGKTLGAATGSSRPPRASAGGVELVAALAEADRSPRDR